MCWRTPGESPTKNKAVVEPENATALPITRPAPLWLLALLTLSGTLGMHIFAPALSSAARSFNVGAGAIRRPSAFTF